MNITADQLETVATPSEPSPPAPPRPSGRRPSAARIATLLAVGLAIAAAVVASAAAATQTVQIAGTPVAISTKTKGFAISVTCTSDADPCAGVLDVKTAKKIRPYSSSPAAVAKVGTFPFTVPAGQTAKVKGRVYGPALAEAMLRGKVQLSIVARLGTPAPAGSRVVLFTYKRL
jgi:hypothetical protein